MGKSKAKPTLFLNYLFFIVAQFMTKLIKVFITFCDILH